MKCMVRFRFIRKKQGGLKLLLMTVICRKITSNSIFLEGP